MKFPLFCFHTDESPLPFFFYMISDHGVAFSEFPFTLPRLVLLFRFVCVWGGKHLYTNESSDLFSLH